MKVSFPYCEYLPPLTEGEVQTRSETTGIIQHPTLEAAVELALSDTTVWKISYATECGWKRFVIR